MALIKKVNVLVIEDNPGDIRLIKEFLAARDEVLFIVDIARDLNDIADFRHQGNYDVILCDLNLPGSSGIETFQLVHKLFSEAPIIVQTGINDEDLGKQAVSEGAQDYLQKGTFDEHLLYKSISYAIERHQLVKNLTREIISKERAKIFEDIFENTSVGVYKTTYSGEFVIANKAFVELLGFHSFEELKKTNVVDNYLNPEKRKTFLEKISKLNKIHGMEEKWRKKDGNVIIISKNARVVRDENGEILYFEGTVEDITKKKEAEEKIKSYNKKLKKLNKDKNKFFSIVAHDLRNPFVPLLGFLNMLSDEYYKMTDNERVGHIKKIEEITINTFNLVKELLEWARVQMQTTKIEKHTINITEIIKKNIDLAEPASINKGVDIRLETEYDINAFADYNMIDAVVRNFISNAIKYTHKNGMVTISCFSESTNVILKVEDTGIGMSKCNLKKLFDLDKIESAPGTNSETGAGLGLILCNEFAERNNGKIWAESKVGKGSKFYLKLPIN